MECSETNTEARVPLMAAIRAHPGSLLLIIGLRLSELVGFYVVILFALSYATENLGISNSTMLAGNIIVAALAFLSLPTFYVLSDRIGRRPVFIAGAVLGVVLAFHYCWALDTGSVMYPWPLSCSQTAVTTSWSAYSSRSLPRCSARSKGETTS
jgi:MHS family shikimate/dehydroshikimate transporter-like MFS transporter